MVDLQRGVQSYLIAKSSLEQDGYEQAPDTVRRPTHVAGPLRRPGRRDGDTKKFSRSGKISRGHRKFFARTSRRLIGGCLPASGAAPLSALARLPSPSASICFSTAARSASKVGPALRYRADPCPAPHEPCALL